MSGQPNKQLDLNAPELYFNRELSWLEFNARVLRQGMRADVPPMERLKFLAIVSSNLDEFFMIRVAGLKQQAEAGAVSGDISGRTPEEQLAAISACVHQMVSRQSDAIKEVFRGLSVHDVHLLDIQSLDPGQRAFVESYFASEILPMLTPLAVAELDPFPKLPGLTLNLAVVLARRDADAQKDPLIAVVPIPRNLPRFTTVPADRGLGFVCIEHVIAHHLPLLFPDRKVEAVCSFRLTRDADVTVEEDEAGDLMRAIKDAVVQRRRRGNVRLEVSVDPDARLRAWLTAWAELSEDDIYETDTVIDPGALMNIAVRPGFDALHDPDWPSQPVRAIENAESIWRALQEQDVLLFHPYDNFAPVLRLLDEAADDPNVLAVKQTLYRVSGDSPIVAALVRAAESGKQVTVLVELKARFDEARNVEWAQRLEDAGCHVIYGIAGLKTHAKLLLVIRREPHGIRRYVHLSTGNYNERTAKLYSDIGLMTTDIDFATDACAFFNLLTGYSQEVGWKRFCIAPTVMRRRIIELIEREIHASTLDQPGLIIVKLNSLQDKEVSEALYRASRAGVKVRLNVRGICCLRPGVEGVSENIEVVSIIDRYLEHARIFYFRNGGHEEVYLSSADWMRRNLERRLELLFPVQEPRLQRRLIGTLRTYFEDTFAAMRLLPDGSYEPVCPSGPPVRAQEILYENAVGAAAEGGAAAQLRPLVSPRTDGDASAT